MIANTQVYCVLKKHKKLHKKNQNEAPIINNVASDLKTQNPTCLFSQNIDQ
ncbi:hypothetical protein NWP96_07190 [Mycoplasmopsis cynos]|nr:hypothetical protein [Mycoplasmopsis cynos]